MRGRRNRRISRAGAVLRWGTGAGRVELPGRSPRARSTWNMLVWNHTKVWVGTLAGLATAVVLPSHWALITRVLTGWNAGLLVLVPLIYLRLRRLDAGALRAHYEEEDPAAPIIAIVVITAALLSLAAIVSLLSTARQVGPGERFSHLLLASLTIANSWVLVHTMFTLRYADIYYSVPPAGPRPLTFPDTPEPLFWDFVYFAFTIGVACQTSDICTNATQVRKVVTAHSVIAFAFNMAVLGFAINVSAGLLGQ